jgi:hypothetical protein
MEWLTDLALRLMQEKHSFYSADLDGVLLPLLFLMKALIRSK